MQQEKHHSILFYHHGDISKKILKIAAEHLTVKSLVIHTGALDVVKQQSEVLKRDFTDLMNKVQCVNTEVFFRHQQPLPRTRNKTIQNNRLEGALVWVLI